MFPGVLLRPARHARALDRQLVAGAARECLATGDGVACRPHGGSVWTAYRVADDGLHFVGQAASARHALALIAAASAAQGTPAVWALAEDTAEWEHDAAPGAALTARSAA